MIDSCYLLVSLFLMQYLLPFKMQNVFLNPSLFWCSYSRLWNHSGDELDFYMLMDYCKITVGGQSHYNGDYYLTVP